jgi:hypothetical protein
MKRLCHVVAINDINDYNEIIIDGEQHGQHDHSRY